MHAHFAEGLHFSAYHSVSSSESESDGPKNGARILEESGIQSALKNAVRCKECGGPVLFKEELFKREGLCTHPYLFCQSCQTKTAIPFAWSGSRSLAETGKVIHHTVLSKQCSGCKKWENEDQTQAEYRAWKENHVCFINFTGSAGAMEPFDTLPLFQRSVGYNLCNKYLTIRWSQQDIRTIVS